MTCIKKHLTILRISTFAVFFNHQLNKETTYQASALQSFHIRSSSQHESLGRPSTRQMSLRGESECCDSEHSYCFSTVAQPLSPVCAPWLWALRSKRPPRKLSLVLWAWDNEIRNHTPAFSLHDGKTGTSNLDRTEMWWVEHSYLN